MTHYRALLLSAGLLLGHAAMGEAVPVPEPTDEAVRFYWTGNALWVVRRFWVLLIPALVVFTGLGAWLCRKLERPIPWLAVQAPVYFVLFIAFLAVVNLPLSAYLGYFRMHEYGLSNQTFPEWFRDYAMSTMVTAVIGALVIWIPYLVIRKWPRYWWAITGALLCPFIFAMIVIVPVVVDPLFNEFGPMQDKELEAAVLEVVHQAGIDDSRVFEVDMSTKTNAVNAYVTGFLGTKRVVLWDTLLEQLEEDEILFIVAHEAAHYVLNHVVVGGLFAVALMFVGLGGVHLAAQAILRRYSGRIGFDTLARSASLPLLYLLCQIMFLVLNPAGNAFSRHIERESDRFGLELMQDNRAAAMAFVKLQETNLGYPRPGPIFTFLRSTHPSLGDRIDFCNTYRPWETGEALRYDHHFQREP